MGVPGSNNLVDPIAPSTGRLTLAERMIALTVLQKTILAAVILAVFLFVIRNRRSGARTVNEKDLA